MNNLRISTRLALGFGLMVFLILLMGGISLVNLHQVDGDVDVAIENRYDKIARFTDLDSDLNLVVRASRNALLVSSPAEVRSLLDQVTDTLQNTAGDLKALDPLMREGSRGRALFLETVDVHRRAEPLIARFVEAMRAGHKDEARRITLVELRPLQLDEQGKLEALVAYERDLMKQASADVDSSIVRMRLAIWTSMAFATLAGALLAAWIIRSVARPLDSAVRASRAVAAGDLSMEIEDAGKNELGVLLAALREMQQGLGSVVADVRRNADMVATASTQIAQGNNDLSSRTEEQASALQQTAASMKQLAATVRQNADSAREGSALAVDASGIAARGGEAVGQVVATMKGINDSSRRIGDIIGVIDGIAFQTNILALNAAVEAARAGEQGRGFAVVAGEVRNLAQRSADAAREIRGLIAASVERVAQGSVLADQAGATMDEVVDAIRRVTALMGEISSASDEQSTGVGQIGAAVQQMDTATQQNAALVEESAAAAASLQSQARQLVGAVSVFKLEAGEEATALASPPAAPAANAAKLEPEAPARTGTDDDWQKF